MVEYQQGGLPEFPNYVQASQLSLERRSESVALKGVYKLTISISLSGICIQLMRAVKEVRLVIILLQQMNSEV